MAFLADAMKTTLGLLFRLQGWSVEGQRPEMPKFVLVGAPHTSNWDFVYYLGAAVALDLDLKFLGKASLFRWPLGGALRDLGGVPVDRSQARDIVRTMVAEFERRDQFILTIAPEGTRASGDRWKTGFYNIAVAAEVPIVFVSIDYPRKLITIGPTLFPSGDYVADMEGAAIFYSTAVGKHPERASSILHETP
jgi:1-acyl-sn-glycerol-3-phosphate acyltransferase